MKIASDEPSSEFGQAAMELDGKMQRFERFALELETLHLDSDKGMARGGELLSELSTCREQLQLGMRELARALGQARDRNEELERCIALRTKVFLERQAEVDSLTARFKTLGDSVHHLNTMV